MQNISLNKPLFQTFLDALIYLFRLFFGELPLPEYKPFVFVAPVGQIELLRNSVKAFELKKCGRLSR